MIIGAGSAVASHQASSKAERAAEEATGATADAARKTLDENVKRVADIQKKESAQARTLLAGSGLGGKSRTSYSKTLQRKQGEELDWIKKSGESNIDTILQGGQAQAQSIRGQGNANLAAGIGTGLKSLVGSGLVGKPKSIFGSNAAPETQAAQSGLSE